MLVRSQTLIFHNDIPNVAAIPRENQLKAVQDLYSIGNTSATFSYSFFIISGGEVKKFAILKVTIVTTRFGEKHPIPESLKAEYGKELKKIRVHENSDMFSKLLELDQNILLNDKSFVPVEPLERLPVLTRPSDCDSNMHVNHAVLASYFYDYLFQFEERSFSVFAIQYLEEVKYSLTSNFEVVATDLKFENNDFRRIYLVNGTTGRVHARGWVQMENQSEEQSKL